MKIVDQNIPPALAALYADLVSTNVSGTVARRRRAAGASQAPRNPSDATIAIGQIVWALALQMGKTGDGAGHRAWRYDRAAEVRMGWANPDYWDAMPMLLSQVYASIPSSTDNDTPPPYAYRDTANAPTTPKYPPGAPSESEPVYTGATTGGRYRDTYWSWRATTHLLDDAATPGTRAPAWVLIDGTSFATASVRPSRPMLSALSRITCRPHDPLPPVDTTPPLDPATSHYWHYEIPDSTPPYYTYTTWRRLFRPLPVDSQGPGGRLVQVDCGPRPMLGLGYNNNTAVTTSLIATHTLYAPQPCAQARAAILAYLPATGRYAALDVITGATQDIDADLNGIAHTIANRAIWPHADYPDIHRYRTARLPAGTLQTYIPKAWDGPYASIDTWRHWQGVFWAAIGPNANDCTVGLITTWGESIIPPTRIVYGAEFAPWGGAQPCGGVNRYFRALWWYDHGRPIRQCVFPPNQHSTPWLYGRNGITMATTAPDGRLYFATWGTASAEPIWTPPEPLVALHYGAAGIYYAITGEPGQPRTIWIGEDGQPPEQAATIPLSIHTRPPHGICTA